MLKITLESGREVELTPAEIRELFKIFKVLCGEYSENPDYKKNAWA